MCTLTESRWYDFGQLYSESSFNESSVPWVNRPVLRPVHTQNTFVPSVNYNYNNYNQNDFSSNHNTLKVQLPNKIVTILVPTSSPVESFSASTSPLDFEETVVTPTKVILKNNDFKKSPEDTNKIHAIEDDNRNGSISSNSSRSDSSDDKAVSYAEIIKHSKPPTKPKQSAKTEHNGIEESSNKKGEFIKSNRIPPSKKVSIKLPDAPFLPNNQHCAFCKNNGEEESVYRTHFVKDELGNVKCPFLSRYTCPHCKATGTKAHTISRCPLGNKNRINKFSKQQ